MIPLLWVFQSYEEVSAGSVPGQDKSWLTFSEIEECAIHE